MFSISTPDTPAHSLTLLKLTRPLILFLRKLVQTISIVLLQLTSVYNSTATLNSLFCYFLSRLSPFPFIYSFFIWTTTTLIIIFVLFSGSEVSDEKIRKNKRNTLISVVVLWCSITDVSVVSYLLLPPLCPFTVPHTLFLFENGITNRFRTP